MKTVANADFGSHESMHLNHNRAVLTMLLVTLMWSTAGMVTRHLEFARSFEVTFWRSWFAFLSLLVILLVQRGRGAFTAILQGGKTFWLSALCWCGMFTFFMLALTTTTVANVLVILAAGPLVTAVMAWVSIGHRPPLRTWLTIVVAGGGIVWMFAGQTGSINWLGAILAMGVPISGAINWTLTQRAHADAQADAHANAHAQADSHNADQGKVQPNTQPDLVPAVMVGGLLSSLITLPMAMPFQSTLHDVGLLAGLGLVQLAIPCMLAVLCAKHLPAPEVSLLALLEVIFGIALAWVGAGETPQPAVLTGGAVVLAAMAFNELVGWRGRNAAARSE